MLPPLKIPDEALPVDPSVETEASIQTLNLLEEVLRVSKREVETGRIRISVLTEIEQHQVSETLRSHSADIQRIAVGRRLAAGEAMPQSRIEGGILIVPVIEEVLVVEKRLVVTEELQIRITHSHEQVQQTVSLRRQRAVVEHLQSANDDVPA